MKSSELLPGTWRARVPIILALAVGLAAGLFLDRLATGAIGPFAAGINFGLIAQSWETIDRVYVERSAIKPEAITYGAISGMVNALGDTGHSRFLSPDMVKRVKEFEQNKFQGIGAEVRIKNGHVVIVAPVPDSPAQKAGLRPGDAILKVDGRDVAGIPLDQVVERITGPAGTKVTLTILSSPSGLVRDVTLTRAHIVFHQVSWHRLPGTELAHLHIANFNKGVSEDLRKALLIIKQEGLQGLIFDLRNNPGGLLNEALGTASQFLSGGNVLLEKNARGVVRPVPVESGGIATQIPMVVLVNGGSASASEIVAGALQDAKRAETVGESTFGTGTVLKEFDLSDGSALLLAIEEWLTPKGHVIWHNGITPNIVVALPANVAPLFPDAEEGMSAAELHQSKDSQLLRALDVMEPAKASGDVRK